MFSNAMDWAQYKGSDPTGKHMMVTLSVAQTASPTTASRYIAALDARMNKCYRGVDGVATPIIVAFTDPAPDKVDASEVTSRAWGVFDAVTLTSGRVVMIVDVTATDPATQQKVAPNPATTILIAQQVFAKYARVHASAPTPSS